MSQDDKTSGHAADAFALAVSSRNRLHEIIRESRRATLIGMDFGRPEPQPEPPMQHTAPPDTYLAYVCRELCKMQPGENLTVSGRELSGEIMSYHHNGALFTAADRVLGNIIGSAYAFSYTQDAMTGDVTFRRHPNTGERHYTDPDRR